MYTHYIAIYLLYELKLILFNPNYKNINFRMKFQFINFWLNIHFNIYINNFKLRYKIVSNYDL